MDSKKGKEHGKQACVHKGFWCAEEEILCVNSDLLTHAPPTNDSPKLLLTCFTELSTRCILAATKGIKVTYSQKCSPIWKELTFPYG